MSAQYIFHVTIAQAIVAMISAKIVGCNLDLLRVAGVYVSLKIFLLKLPQTSQHRIFPAIPTIVRRVDVGGKI